MRPSRLTPAQRTVAITLLARTAQWTLTEAELVWERIDAIATEESAITIMRRLNPLTPGTRTVLEQAGLRLRFPPEGFGVGACGGGRPGRRSRRSRAEPIPGQLQLPVAAPPLTICQGTVALDPYGELPHPQQLADPDRRRVSRGRLAEGAVGRCAGCGREFAMNTFGRPAVRCPECRRRRAEAS